MKTILIVDDRADNRAVLIAMLTHRKYRLIEASSGAEALAIVRKEKPDLVIADVLMPKMDGYEFVQQLRQDREIAQTKVIFYTASYIEEESRELATACGVEHVIIKPAEPEAVFKVVDAAFGTVARTAPAPAPEFAREHLNLVSNKLVEKVEELENLTATLEQEIVQRKNAQKTLEWLRRQHELILNSAGEGIHGLDLAGNIIFENPKAAALLGWPGDQLLGKPAHATFHHTRPDGGKYPLEDCPIHASTCDGITRRITNDVFWRNDGSHFRVDYVCAPIKDEKGKIQGAIVTFKDITDQFAAEARQKLREQQYRLLFETNPNPMWVFDTRTQNILAVNQTATVQYGYTRDEFLRLNIKNLRPAKDVPDLIRARALSSPQPMSHFSGEFRHVRKDSSLIRVEIYSSPIVWDGVSARLVTAIDVTERKRAGERMQAILESALDCIVTMDHQGRVVEFNPAAEETFGYQRNEAIGQLLSELIIPPSLRERHRLGLANYLATGDGPVLGKHIELTAMRRDGSEFPVEIAITRIGLQDPPLFTGFIRDITERKRADERVREQADIINRAQDAIIVRDFASDLVTVWNSGAERLYGWSASEAIGQPIRELIFPEANQRDELLQQLVSTGEFSGEIKHRAKDGREVIVDSRVTLIRNDDGTPRAVLGINTDITEQKQLETQLLRSQRLESIGTLASGVAHDLNNIMTPILMCAEILREKVNDAEATHAVALIEQSARRGASVLKQVLTFARGIEGERVTIDPRHLIEEIVDIARKTFSKSIEITASYPEQIWAIQGDPTQLHQVLLNLSVNARDAMPNGGSLVIAAENVDLEHDSAAMLPTANAGPHVRIQVSDTGTGMSSATIENVFDPFFTTKEIGKGTGLGLSTALGIVKSHGGFFSIESELGRGSSFKIFFPAIDVQTAPAKTNRPKLIQGENELVLLVDDEKSVREVTKIILEKNNYRVIEARDGPEALSVFGRHSDSVDVVLTDINLPRMNGVALIRAIQKMKPQMIFIASSGQDHDVHAPELRSLNVANVLGKPYDSSKLLQVLDEALADTPK